MTMLFQESVYYGTKLGQEYMDQHAGGRGGVIVNVASMAGLISSSIRRQLLSLINWSLIEI